MLCVKDVGVHAESEVLICSAEATRTHAPGCRERVPVDTVCVDDSLDEELSAESGAELVAAGIGLSSKFHQLQLQSAEHFA